MKLRLRVFAACLLVGVFCVPNFVNLSAQAYGRGPFYEYINSIVRVDTDVDLGDVYCGRLKFRNTQLADPFAVSIEKIVLTSLRGCILGGIRQSNVGSVGTDGIGTNQFGESLTYQAKWFEIASSVDRSTQILGGSFVSSL